MSLSISENIKKLPKRKLKAWIKSQEHRESQDWKDALKELKESMNVKGTGGKSKED